LPNGRRFFATAFKEEKSHIVASMKDGAFLTRDDLLPTDVAVNMSKNSRRAFFVSMGDLLKSREKGFDKERQESRMEVSGKVDSMPASPAYAACLLCDQGKCDDALRGVAFMPPEIPSLSIFVMPPEDAMCDWERGFEEAAGDFGFKAMHMVPGEAIKAPAPLVGWICGDEPGRAKGKFGVAPVNIGNDPNLDWMSSQKIASLMVARAEPGEDKEGFFKGYQAFADNFSHYVLGKAKLPWSIAFSEWTDLSVVPTATSLLRCPARKASPKEMSPETGPPSIGAMAKAMASGGELALNVSRGIPMAEGEMWPSVVLAKAAARLVKKWETPDEATTHIMEQNWDEFFLVGSKPHVVIPLQPRNCAMVNTHDQSCAPRSPNELKHLVSFSLGRLPLGKRIHVCGGEALKGLEWSAPESAKAFKDEVERLTHKKTGHRRPADDFVHLHCHSHYSLLDGVSSPEDMAATAYGLGQPAIALTDHGYMFANFKFQKACDEWGMKAIHGVESYFVRDHGQLVDGHSQSNMYHLTLLAMDADGWRTLCRLMSSATKDRFYYKPRVDLPSLAADNKGVICMAACAGGPLAYHLRQEGWDPALAERNMADLLGIFGGRLYNEAMQVGFKEYDESVGTIVEFADAMGVKTVATADAHYPRREDSSVQETLLKIGTGGNLESCSDLLYIKPRKDMVVGPVTEEHCDNTLEVASRCSFELRFEGTHYPEFDPKGAPDYREFLAETGRAG
jgi:hypothetical protein